MLCGGLSRQAQRFTNSADASFTAFGSRFIVLLAHVVFCQVVRPKSALASGLLNVRLRCFALLEQTAR